MSKLAVCSSCLGFVNTGAAACPHCDAPQVSRASTGTVVKAVIAAVAGLGFMSTMMACYGCPPPGCGGGTDSGLNNDTGVTTHDSGTSDAAVSDAAAPEDASIDGGG